MRRFNEILEILRRPFPAAGHIALCVLFLRLSPLAKNLPRPLITNEWTLVSKSSGRLFSSSGIFTP